MIAVGNHAHAIQIAAAAGTIYNPVADQCISRTEDGELLGGVLFQAYTGASIGMHMAGFRPKWANRDMLWAGFHYPFEQLKCERVFGQVPASNRLALEIDLKLGFKEVARIPRLYPGDDAIIVCMEREECRWLAVKPRTIRSRSES
jgi:RimJ/RimL family protein N-acetyltransferase